MPEDVKKSRNVSFGCMSWAGVFLSVAIIAIRAFQPNSTPMETWSFGSWMLMLMPVVFPLALGVLALVAWFIAYVIASTFKKY